MQLKYSVVIPTYNEEDNVKSLYQQLKPVMDELAEPYEIIYIDDGSTDDTYKALENLHNANGDVKVIKFRRNFGQTAALSAGFEFAKGDVVIVMDADLQNDPEDIPRLIVRLNEGYDVVSGWRHPRKDRILKRLFSKLSNRLVRRLMHLDIHDEGCSLKVYKRETLKDIELYGELHRFVPALIAMKGFRVGEVKVTHHPRVHGKTKYDFWRLIKGFLDLLYIKFWAKYASRPLHFFGLLGFVLIAAGCIIAAEKVLLEFLYLKLPLEVGPMLLLSVLTIIMGLQFFVFGFLSEIQIRIYYQRFSEKNYNIEKILD